MHNVLKAVHKSSPSSVLLASARTFMHTAMDPRYRQLSIKLDLIAPRFDLPAGAVTVLTEPSDFYRLLKSKISRAERRIFLSTLYIGTTEFDLVSSQLGNTVNLTISD